MPRLSIHLLTISAISVTFSGLATPTLAQSVPAAPRRAVLVGADWCAPCKAELADLPALAAAVAPDRLTLAWLDHAPAVPPALAATVETLSPGAAQAVAARHQSEARGVPFTVLYDRAGKPCTVWRGPLHPADIPLLRQRCPQP